MLQSHLDLPHLVDLSCDAHETDDVAGLIVERQFRRQGPIRPAITQLAAFYLADDRSIRLHDP